MTDITKVHFTWYGEINENTIAAALDGPIAYAKKFPNQQFVFCCKQDEENNVYAQLTKHKINNLKALSIEKLLDEFKTKQPGLASQIIGVLNEIDTTGYYKNLGKEFSQLMIMYLYGGYHLDTTIYPSSPITIEKEAENKFSRKDEWLPLYSSTLHAADDRPTSTAAAAPAPATDEDAVLSVDSFHETPGTDDVISVSSSDGEPCILSIDQEGPLTDERTSKLSPNSSDSTSSTSDSSVSSSDSETIEQKKMFLTHQSRFHAHEMPIFYGPDKDLIDVWAMYCPIKNTIAQDAYIHGIISLIKGIQELKDHYGVNDLKNIHTKTQGMEDGIVRRRPHDQTMEVKIGLIPHEIINFMESVSTSEADRQYSVINYKIDEAGGQYEHLKGRGLFINTFPGTKVFGTTRWNAAPESPPRKPTP